MERPVLITLGEAQERLRVSNHTIARLVREGVLKTVPNPLDKRQKLVERDAVERLRPPLEVSPGKRMAAA